jgi:hypothetical protein
MRISYKGSLVLAGFLALRCGAVAAEPVRRIDIYVQPFYQAAATSDGKPQVAVGDAFNALLASNRPEDILRARELIVRDPKLVTPMTMMVLAIRLYDAGLRDDAVFWFYVAKDRFLVMSEVLDMKPLAGVDDAIGSFATLAGPIINGYAFCDLANQAALHTSAVDWVEQNPYQVMFMERFAAVPGDRNESVKRAVAKARERAAKERGYFTNSKNVEALYAARRANDADVKYCWK